MKPSLISLVMPCYNDAVVVPYFFARLQQAIARLSEYDFEFLFVNDGSTDHSAIILNAMAAADSRVKVLHLAANRGHQIALISGMDHVRGDIVVSLDVDLQDPPELIPELVEKIREGYDIVHTQRRSRIGESAFKLASAAIFYRFISRISEHELVPSSGDFRAFTRPVLNDVKRFRERRPYLRGLFATIGFRQTIIPYDRGRRFAGETKYTVRKMLRLTESAVFGFSSAPVSSLLWIVGLLGGVASVTAIKCVAELVLNGNAPSAVSLVVGFLTFSSALVVLALWVVASYLARIYEEVKDRPLYTLADSKNLFPALSPGVRPTPELAQFIALDKAFDVSDFPRPALPQ